MRNQPRTPTEVASPSAEAGFTLIELMMVTAILGVLSSMSMTAYELYGKKTRDGVRKLHLEQFAKMLRAENFAGGSLATVASYGESSHGGWDISSFDPNGNGQMFLEFLGPNQPVDPKNKGDPHHFPAPDSFAYYYYCYWQPHTMTWWGHTGTSNFALLATKLELTGQTHYIIVDHVNCL